MEGGREEGCVLSISICFESSSSGFRPRTVDCTVRILAPYSGLHCTEPESGTGRFKANGNQQLLATGTLDSKCGTTPEARGGKEGGKRTLR